MLFPYGVLAKFLIDLTRLTGKITQKLILGTINSGIFSYAANIKKLHACRVIRISLFSLLPVEIKNVTKSYL